MTNHLLITDADGYLGSRIARLCQNVGAWRAMPLREREWYVCTNEIGTYVTVANSAPELEWPQKQQETGRGAGRSPLRGRAS